MNSMLTQYSERQMSACGVWLKADKTSGISELYVLDHKSAFGCTTSFHVQREPRIQILSVSHTECIQHVVSRIRGKTQLV